MTSAPAFWIAGLLVAMTTSQARAADTAADTRPVTSFHAIDVNGIGELQLSQGHGESLVVEAEARILPNIVTRVQNGVLIIELRGSVRTNLPVRYRVGVRTLDSLRFSGAVSVDAGPLSVSSLTLESQGSGSARLAALRGASLDARIQGAGAIELQAGQVDRQTVHILGSGAYEADHLASHHCSVVLAGSGDASVAARDDLDVSITGSGSVHYRGRPRLSSSVTGAGSVDRAGD